MTTSNESSTFPPNATGFNEWVNEFQELDDRTWPTVRQDQGHRLRILRLDVDEVNVQPIDRRQKLGETIELSLESAPVVFSLQ